MTWLSRFILVREVLGQAPQGPGAAYPRGVAVDTVNVQPFAPIAAAVDAACSQAAILEVVAPVTGGSKLALPDRFQAMHDSEVKEVDPGF